VRLNRGEYFGTREHVATLVGVRITRAEYKPRAQLPRHSHVQPYLCLVGGGGFEERSRQRVETCTLGTAVWNPAR
jgi:hypothetical protein